MYMKNVSLYYIVNVHYFNNKKMKLKNEHKKCTL